MATNRKPSFDANDQALFQRIRLIPFTVTFPPDKPDKSLPEKLKAEAKECIQKDQDNVLSKGFKARYVEWCLELLIELRRRGIALSVTSEGVK